MIDPTPFIRSYVPGRLRLRHPGLIGLEGETLEALTSTVKSAPGITGCTVNPKVGSLLLIWDTFSFGRLSCPKMRLRPHRTQSIGR